MNDTPPLRLEEVAADRDNNFNLIRFLAASLVIVSHSYPLAWERQPEIVSRLLITVTGGDLAVSAFFVVSGFLVSQSFANRGSVRVFLLARALRIYPALIVAAAFATLLGGAFSTLPWREFLAHPQTHSFFLTNATAWVVQYPLPGVFGDHPHPGAVNGSLWTLPIELRMYLCCALVGALGILANRVVFSLAFFASVLLFSALPEAYPLWPNDAASRKLALCFALGVLFHLNRRFVVLRLRWAALMVGVAAFTWQSEVMQVAKYFLLAYLLLVAAYHPRLRFAAFNRLGDYSYGLYIYAFPVQQAIVALVPGVGPGQLMMLAFPLVLVLALLSWHLLEKPALGLKSAPWMQSSERLPESSARVAGLPENTRDARRAE
ncbi:hypothetical protein BURK2_01695 [Burkholderiales bacterium]|nr:hypothetical protein BURK2_01695 [Burkholderiales bacterium]